VFDYIIVGGGSAGCVLANRLTADGRTRVLLLEAGGTAATPLVNLSFGFALMLNRPRYDWRFQIGPEPGLGGRTMPYPRGRLLGGSSSINAMLYVRGLKRDYDAWRDEGLAGWGWDDVEPYLRKAEDYPYPRPNARGRDGPVKVTPSPNLHPISARVVEAAGQCRVGATTDYNGPEPSGLGVAQLFYRDGRRSGAAAAYLRPAMRRHELCVETGAVVDRVLFDGRRAVGVRYAHQGRLKEVRAGEVILCAGAIGSPQLLEISGVGQTERLKAIGVDPVHHLPTVGEHLQDHYLVFVVQALKDIRGLSAELAGWRGLWNGAQYLLLKRGYLNGTPTQISGHANADIDGAPVGLQFMGMPLSFTRDANRNAIVRHPRSSLMLGVNVCHPRSRGHVHARSGSMEDAPEIVANFMTDEMDVKATVAGLHLCREILAQPVLDSIRAEEIAPGGAVDDYEALAGYARIAGASAYHPVGTCRMAKDRAHGVVDAALRVHGLAGLRVVDASVMPRLVSANTHAPTVMIAERAADLIKADRHSPIL